MTEARRAARRRFLLNAVSAGGGIGLAGFPVAAAAQTASVFRFQGAWSSRDIGHEYALDYAWRVADMSGGRLRIEVLPAGAVAKPPDLLDAVHKGALDGCHASPDLWSRKNSAFALFGAGPALGMDANSLLAWMRYGGGDVLYRELYGGVMNLDVVGFLCGPMPSRALGWFRKPVTSPGQLKGLRIGANGLSAELFRQMGAVVSEGQSEEFAAAVDRGVLDGAESSNPASDRQAGLATAARTCTMPSYSRSAGTFEVLFNRKKFEALPADLQSIARYAAEAAGADMSWKSIHHYSQDYAELREKGVARFVKAPGELLRAELRAWSAVTARKSQENPLFQRVLESQKTWARRVVRWAMDSTADPRLAYDHWFSSGAGAARK